MNMRVYCRCGNMLTNQLDPNDTEYYVYSDREWCEIQKNEYIHVLDIPYPHAVAIQTTNLKRAKNTVCKRAMPQLNHTLYIRNTLIKYILLQKLWAYVRYQTTSILHLTLSARS